MISGLVNFLRLLFWAMFGLFVRVTLEVLLSRLPIAARQASHDTAKT